MARFDRIALVASAAALSAAALAMPARADYQVIDANGAKITIKSTTCGTKQCAQAIPTDASGNPYTPSNLPPNPSGAATAGNQTDGNTTLAAIRDAIKAAVTTPRSGFNSVVGATVGTTSAQVLAAATGARYHLALDNESATATIACAFGAPAALGTAGSFSIPPGLTRTWSGAYVPADAIFCIATASGSPLTVQSN